MLLLSILFSGGSKLESGAISGVLLQFIGSGFFIMYNKSLDQLKLFYSKLVRLQDTMLAVQQCELILVPERDRVRETLITLLMSPHSIEKGKSSSPRTSSELNRQRLRDRSKRTRTEPLGVAAPSAVNRPAMEL